MNVLMLRTYLVYKVYYAKQILPFCSAEKGLSFIIKVFHFRLFLAIDLPVYYGRVLFPEYHFRKTVTGNVWDNQIFKIRYYIVGVWYNE